ncbi:MAG TPA: hypothetical protein ENJ18_10260 [Nannocystis exedens]|nr:hypothetical protein [Nannocystis exedens]
MSTPLQISRLQRSRRQWLLRSAGVVVGLCIAPSCADRRAASVDPTQGAKQALVPVAEIPVDFLARQRLSGRMGEHDLHSEVILQKQGDVLTLLGLTPFATKAFSLVQRGVETEFTSFVEVALPFPPELMLADIHRTLFVGIDGKGSDDGHRRLRLKGERIDETWQQGRLLGRVFRRRRGRPKGLIVIDYGEGMSAWKPPPKITIDNQRLGYQVTIETVVYQPLVGSESP